MLSKRPFTRTALALAAAYMVVIVAVVVVAQMLSIDSAEAQTTPPVRQVELRLPAVPAGGIAGFSMQGALPQGQIATVGGDFNGNGNLDFNDVVVLFQSTLPGGPPLPGATPTTGQVGRIVGMTIPAFGVETHAFTDTTFTLNIADTATLLEDGGADVLLATFDIEEVASGHTVLYGYTYRDETGAGGADDDSGNPLPNFSVSAQVSH